MPPRLRTQIHNLLHLKSPSSSSEIFQRKPPSVLPSSATTPNREFQVQLKCQTYCGNWFSINSRVKEDNCLLKKNMTISISDLPNDILVHVLSLLTMKEAGRTSVVSKGWRHMWEYNPTLNFDSRSVLDELKLYSRSGKVQGRKYLKWVNQVVSLHRAPVFGEFRVRFDINFLAWDSCTDNSIDNWFRFAMEKRVTRLEIDLSLYYEGYEPRRHTFPINMSSLCCTSSLTSLELGCVNINGEILESFLCNCRALEYLSVKHSDSLVHLKVVSGNLKHLRIYYCDKMKGLEISAAPNLESVCYYGPKINVQFKSTPKLAQLSFGSRYASANDYDLNNICSDLVGCLPQIKELTLHSSHELEFRSLYIEESVLFTRLEKLDVMANPRPLEDLYCFIPLIKACPLLKHFKLRLLPYRLLLSKRRVVRKRRSCPHYHLKIVEIMGFVGHAVDVEFAAYLMECAVSLDMFIADTRVDNLYREFGDMTERRRGARKWAELLCAYFKPDAKLQVI